MTEINYRENVAGILRNKDGKILICERLNVPGAWQFPQGGVDGGETLEQALEREIWEEIGVEGRDYRVVEGRGPYRYVFGEGRTKRGYHGKEQHYFLCDFVGPDSRIKVDQKNAEFSAWQWIAPAEFKLSWLPSMKTEVYRAVFRDFFAINL